MSQWSEYLAFGWRLCELRPGKKAPRADGWQAQDAPPFNEAALGAGLVHQWSGTAALDVDDYDKAKAWLAARDVDLDALFAAPDSVQIISGRSNHGKLLYALPEALKSKKIIEAKRNILDFRCIGNQDVLPPSIHPDTSRPYRWLGDPLLGLPRLPAALEALWRSLLAPATDVPPAPPEQAGEAELAELLASRDPDCDYLEWLKVGMAVHAATNGQGFYIWDNWARKGDKYNVPAEGSGLVGVNHLMSKWRSFHADGGVGVGSLRAEKVAAPEEFPTDAEAEFTGPADDVTPAGVAQSVLRPRLCLLTGQGRFYFMRGEPAIAGLDEHGETLLPTDETVNKLFTRHMPELVNQKTGARTRRPPTDFLKDGVSNPLIAYNLGFHPGEPRIYVDPVDGRQYLNRYIPTLIEPLRPLCHEIEAWEWLIGRIQSEHFRRWLLQFYAYCLKHPGQKIQSAPLLFSKTPGTGKSTLMKLVPKLLFGRRWVRTVSNEEINSRFTGFLADNWFVVLDELKTNGGKMDRVALANKMKPWITEPDLPIERKGENAYSITNRLQITATSNYDDAVQIDDDDRRWGICGMDGDTMTAAEKADLFSGFLNTPRAPGVLRYIFNEVDLVGFDPTGEAPRTLGRTVMVSTGLGTWENKLVEAAAGAHPPFDKDIVTLESVRDLLIGSAAPPLRKVLSLLQSAPFRVTKLRTSGARLYCWRNADQWKIAGPTAALRYMETGVRPAGKWSNEVPLAIRLMAGDDTGDDVTDLLGDPDGRR